MKPLQIRSNERITVVGATGTGKSYLAQRLALNAPRVIVLDPKAELIGEWDIVPYDQDARRALLNGEPVRATYTPEVGADDYESVCRDVYEAGNCVLYVDEVYGVIPPGTKPPPYFSAIYTRGRALGIGVVACTQRPTWVPLFIFSEAQWFIMFELLMTADRKRMAEFMGEEVMRPIAHPHGFYIKSVHWRGKPARYFAQVQALPRSTKLT